MSLTSSKKIETNVVELEIAIEGDQFKAATDAAYVKMAKDINVPGFRKGKAPRSIIEKMYGEDIFVQEAVNMLYPTAYEAAVDEAKITPVDKADIEIIKADVNGFTFKAKVTVKPEIELGEYKGIEVDKNVYSAMAADVNAEIDRLRERNARAVDVDNRAVKKDDAAIIDFEGFADGVAFEGGKGEDYPLTIGSNTFIPGFEDQIIGHKIGEEFDVNVKFPEEYHAEDLKGKDAVFKVIVKSISVKELPKADDEFAKDISEFDTLKELKADIKSKIQESMDSRSSSELEEALSTKVIEGLKGEIPSVMFDNKVNDMVQDFEYRLQSQGMNLEVYTQYTGTTISGLKETFKTTAEYQVKTRLALEKIVELESLEATDEEIEAEYNRLAEAYKMDLKQVKSFIPKEDLALDICVGKAVDFIRENAKITEVKVKKSASKKDDKDEEDAE